jgi:phospholipase C
LTHPTRRWALALAVLFALGPGIASASNGEGGGSQEESGDRTRSPIKHTIILYQENISFDHYFGTYGHGSNGIPAGSSLSYTNGTQTWGPFTPTKLNGTTQDATCDVDHGYTDMIKMANQGAINLYLQLGNDKILLNPSTNTTCPKFETVTPPGTGVKALANAYYTGTAGDPTSPLQNYWRLASQYTLADNFFSAMYGPSTPGAEWLVAATANTVHDPNPVGDVCNDYPAGISPQNVPNLGQEASAAGTSWAWFQGGFGTCVPGTPVVTNGYSAHHDPFQYFTSTADLTHQYAFDPKLDYSQANKHQRDLSVLYDALAASPVSGTAAVPKLPDVSWVKAPAPGDGHPAYSGPQQDDAFVADLVSRLKGSRYWKNTALIVAFDETGGWWDHVVPKDLGGPFATLVGGQPNLSGCQYPGDGLPCGEGGLGPRMPVLVISKFAKRGFVDHTLLETSSLTKWVEWNHRLPALGVWGNRDRTAGSLNSAFRFDDQEGD